jgi:hypothetical protein
MLATMLERPRRTRRQEPEGLEACTLAWRVDCAQIVPNAYRMWKAGSNVPREMRQDPQIRK